MSLKGRYYGLNCIPLKLTFQNPKNTNTVNVLCDFLIPICQNVKAMIKICIILLDQKVIATYTGYTRKGNVGKLRMITVMSNRNLRISLIMTDLSQYPWN